MAYKLLTRRTLLQTLFVLVAAVDLGALVRLTIISSGDFPLNDGGLFTVMAQDIAHAGYRLPVVSSYNGIRTPFAYPPLGFYLAAVLTNVFGWSLLDIARYLPLAINLLTIPAYYLLAHAMLKSQWQASLAVIAFALLPRTFKFLIMGGGLSRSPGLLFAVLLMWQAYLLYTTGNRRHLLPTILFAGLTTVSHPEMMLYAGLSCFLFFLFCGRNRQGALHTAMVIAGTVILTAPWWLAVVSAHGLSPFLSAYQTGEQSAFVSVALLLTGVGFVEQTLLGVMALLGGLRCIATRRYLLPVWLISIFVLAPRSAQTFAVVVVPLLIALDLDEVIFPALITQSRGKLARNILLFMLVVYSVFTAFNTYIPVLAAEERDAMRWAGRNTPASGQFVVLSGYDWYEDAISEWFPVLSGRRSMATVQGYEWFPKQEFQFREEQHKALQECGDVNCLELWARKTGVSYSYVYISGTRMRYGALRFALEQSPDYHLIYNGPGALIFARTVLL